MKKPTTETFAERLRFLAGNMTAAQVASAISPSGDCSIRTVENWMMGRNEPASYARSAILTSVYECRLKLEGIEAHGT